MKNVILTLFFLSGFSIVGLQAQKCPPCPACPLGCCIVSTDKARNGSSALIMPETFNIMAAYPTAKTVGLADTKCTPAEIAACKAYCNPNTTACSTANAPQCQSASSVAFQPSVAPQCQPAASTSLQTSTASQCQPAACKSGHSSTAASFPQSQQTSKPMKG